MAELIRRARGSVDFTVVSARLAPELRPLVAWRRIPAPRRPFPLRFLTFFVVAGMRLRRERTELVHATGAIVPNRLDLVTVHFCHHGYRARVGGLAAPGLRGRRRAGRAVTRVLGLLAERWCYRGSRARRLAAVSPGQAEELARLFPEVPVTVTPNGVDLEPDRATGAGAVPPSKRDGEVVALFVGADFDRKGLAVAIEAVERTRAEAAVPLRLWVVGGGQREPYDELIARLGMIDAVEFFGARPDVERFYAEADIFVLPTLYETFCLAAYEAARAGLPIVATPVPGISELVGEGEAGVLVERSGRSVAAALSTLVENPARRRQLGRNAAERAAPFTWERSVERVLDLYRELSANRA